MLVTIQFVTSMVKHVAEVSAIELVADGISGRRIKSTAQSTAGTDRAEYVLSFRFCSQR